MVRRSNEIPPPFVYECAYRRGDVSGDCFREPIAPTELSVKGLSLRNRERDDSLRGGETVCSAMHKSGSEA